MQKYATELRNKLEKYLIFIYFFFIFLFFVDKLQRKLKNYNLL